MAEGDARRAEFAQAFKQLMAGRSFDGITVAEIAERAGYSRKTFYSYFSSKVEVLEWICYIELIRAQEEELSRGGWTAFRALLDFFRTDRHFFASALSDDRPGAFGAYFLQLLTAILYLTMADGFREELDDERAVTLCIRSLAESGKHAVMLWLEDPAEPSVDALMGFLVRASRAFARMIQEG